MAGGGVGDAAYASGWCCGQERSGVREKGAPIREAVADVDGDGGVADADGVPASYRHPLRAVADQGDPSGTTSGLPLVTVTVKPSGVSSSETRKLTGDGGIADHPDRGRQQG